MLRYMISQFRAKGGPIVHLPKTGIFGEIPSYIIDTAIMSHHHAKFKKLLTSDSKNKASKFFGLKLEQK